MDQLAPLLIDTVPPVVWMVLFGIAAYLLIMMVKKTLDSFVSTTRESFEIQREAIQELKIQNAVHNERLEHHDERIGAIEEKVFIVKHAKK